MGEDEHQGQSSAYGTRSCGPTALDAPVEVGAGGFWSGYGAGTAATY